MMTNKVPGFDPKINGFHFNDNDFPQNANYPVISLPIVGTIYNDASKGICDGMVYTVLDMFLHIPKILPLSDTTPPVSGSDQFKYLTQREMNCWFVDNFSNFWKAFEWIHTPNHDTWFQRGISWWTVVEEWPKIKHDIDSGMPSPIWVVTSPSCPVTNIPQTINALTNHHQVLVYGYLLDDSNNLTLNFYEPQGFGHDATIVLNISNPEHTINFTAESITWASVRGFFRSDYHQSNPQPFFINQGGAPTATTLNATNVTSTSATLNGMVNPKGFATQVDFASDSPSDSPSYFPSTPSQNIGSGTADITVSYTLTGLKPGTTYSYAVRASNNHGGHNGALVNFTTQADNAPIATTLNATNITSTSATLNGMVNPKGFATQVDFASGSPSDSPSYFPSTPSQNIGSGTAGVTVSYILTGLKPGTTYSYVVRASNSQGGHNGALVTFTTQADNAPTATTQDATNITSTSATLNGMVNPKGFATQVDFASGSPSDSPSYFPLTPSQNIGSGTAEVAVSYVLTGLKPGTTYSYVVRASNSQGGHNGALVTFTTLV